MESGNRICVDCGYTNADFFCSCTDPETFLCEQHTTKHMQKASRKGHQMWPLSALSNYKNPRFLDRLKVFPRVREEALEAIREVDKAIEEVTAKVEELRIALNVLYSEKMQELRKIKANVSASLEEVERTLAEEQPRLILKFAALIRDCAEHPAPLQLFTYSISASPALLELQFTLPPATRLAGVYNHTAFLYEVSSQELTQHTLSVNFGNGGSYIECDKDTLLCVGGNPASSNVYSLNLSSFQLSSLPSFSSPRLSPGLAKVNTQFYALGGSGLSSCEKMQLSDKRWTPMSSMNHPRYAFTPCYFRALLYLVSPRTTRAVETFSPEKQSFTVLPVSLPSDLRLKNSSVAFIANEELCVLTYDKQMARWKIDWEREFRLSDTTEYSWSSQQPLIVGSLVLIACRGTVQQFSLETYSFLD